MKLQVGITPSDVRFQGVRQKRTRKRPENEGKLAIRTMDMFFSESNKAQKLKEE